MTSKEKVEILLKYFGDEDGNIDLSGIDFGNKLVYNIGQKANAIYNGVQKARLIYNYYQEADEIYNNDQKANEIKNNWQEAYKIDNNNQAIKIKNKYEEMSKEQLIARIEELENER